MNRCFCTHAQDQHRRGAGKCTAVDPEYGVTCGCRSFVLMEPVDVQNARAENKSRAASAGEAA